MDASSRVQFHFLLKKIRVMMQTRDVPVNEETLLENLKDTESFHLPFLKVKLVLAGTEKKDLEEWMSTSSQTTILIYEGLKLPRFLARYLDVAELFSVNEILLDPVHHLYSPKKVRALPDTDRFYQETGFAKDNLPRILITDPLVKYYGFRVDDVLEIERDSPASGLSLYYRLVVEIN